MIPASEYAKFIDADFIRGIVNMLVIDLIVIILHIYKQLYISWHEDEEIDDD